MKKIAVVLVLALAGCTPIPGSSPANDGSSGGESPQLGSTACLVDRNWELDIADMAAQLGETMSSSGVTVVSSTGAGEAGIYFDHEGYAGSASTVSYTIVIDMGDGLVMTMVQHHEGSPSGTWSWEGSGESTVVFEGWTGGLTVTTDTSINGMAAPTSTTPLSAGLDGQAMTVSCDGDTLVTQSQGSPFTSRWHTSD